MINFFRKNNNTGQVSGKSRFGCISRRDTDVNRPHSDEVIIVKETGGVLNVSKFSRKASLETVRLNGLIKTSAVNYQARTLRLPELKFDQQADDLQVGAAFIHYLKSQNKVSLDEKRVDFSVDPAGIVAGITAFKKDVVEASVSVEGFRARADQSCPVEVETRGRAVLRFYLNHNVPRQSDIDDISRTVFSAVIEDHGYSLIIWDQLRGVCWEVEQPSGGNELFDNWEAAAFEIKRMLSTASLKNLGIEAVDNLVVAATDDCVEFVNQQLSEDNIKLEQIEFNEGVHFNMSEGSQALGRSRIDALVAAGLVIEESRLPAINLNRNLETFIRERQQEQVRAAERTTATANRNLTILLVSPAALIFVCCFIWYAMLFLQESYVDRRLEKANAEDARLSEVKKQIQKVKDSSDEVKVVSESIGALKKRQPANFLLLMALNRKWASLGSWQIDEITSKADGTITIKGKTNNDDNLTEFAKSLDFSEEFESVKVSKGENVGGGTGAMFVPTAAVGSLPGSGVIKFAVEARYRPLAAFGSAPVKVTVPGATAPNLPPPATVPPPQVANGVNAPKPPNG